MKATLFEDEDMEVGEAGTVPNAGDISQSAKSRPVVLERRDQLIEDIASSMLGN